MFCRTNLAVGLMPTTLYEPASLCLQHNCSFPMIDCDRLLPYCIQPHGFLDYRQTHVYLITPYPAIAVQYPSGQVYAWSRARAGRALPIVGTLHPLVRGVLVPPTHSR